MVNSSSEKVPPSVVSHVDAALSKSKEATEVVREVAGDLAVVHAVLDSGISPKLKTTDVGIAVAHTSALERRLTHSVELLEEAAATLQREARSDEAGASARHSVDVKDE